MRNIFLLLIAVTVVFASCEKEKTGSHVSNHFFLRNNNADMPVYVEGNVASNIFVIVLHGGPGDEVLVHKHLLNDFTDELEENYAMVYWQQRCAGSSQGNVDRNEVQLSDYVDDLEKLLILLMHQYGQQIEFFLMGHSWGGALGTMFLLEGDNQRDIQGWIEICGAHDGPLALEFSKEKIITTGENQIALGNNINKWEEIVYDAKQADLSTLDGKIEVYLSGFESENLMVDSMISVETGTTKDYISASFFKPFNLFSNIIPAPFSENFYEELNSLSLTDDLSEISIPSLFLYGRYDFLVPDSFGYSAYNEIGTNEKEILILEKSEHWPMKTEPEKCRIAVITFIDKYK
ncbi:MAG: alpha/beta hydrolase [Bacteroidales bacterium]|nr:alpha/beta hydrolase [Bacteroidales bacterium]MBN2821397.1 alpha/beta hydrolase [Bacteroidales bacterium]